MHVRSRAKITAKGQLTLPAVVRHELGVDVGDVVTFEFSDAGIRLLRDSEPGIFADWIGRYREGRGIDAAEIDRRIAELRERDAT